MTLALLHMQALTEGKSVYQLAVEIYGEEEARRLLGMVADADGKTATTTFTVVSQGLDEAGNTVETIRLADGTEITVVVGVSGLDQLGKADSDIKAVTLADGTVVTVKTDVDTTGWENSTFGDIIANGKSVDVETVLKPPTGWSVDDWNNSDGEGSTGGLPDIELDTTLKTPTEAPPYSGPPVELPVTFSVATAGGVGPTKVPGGMESALGDPITQTVTLDVVDNASGPIGEVQTAADKLGSTNSVVSLSAVNGASSVILGAQSLADDFGVTNVSATLGANDNASGTIQGVIDLMGSFESKTVTLSVVTAYSTIGTPPKATEHGGLIGYASGGLIPHIAAEGDRAELAHYANGGVAVLPREDVYLNPPGTYISPAPANPGIAAGGISIVFTGNFNGSNRLELNEWAEQDLLPAIADTITTHRRQFGG